MSDYIEAMEVNNEPHIETDDAPVNICPKCGGDSTGKGLLVDFWEERDRLGIWVTDAQTGDIVFEVWDDDA